MKKYIILLLLLLPILLIVSCNQDYLIVNIEYGKNIDINKDTYVYLNDEIIGKVIDIKQMDNKNIIKIGIASEYKNDINEDARFYILNSDNKIVVMRGNSEIKMQNNITVKGNNELQYLIHKGANIIVNKINDFLQSKEWEDFKNNLDIIIDKSKNDVDSILPEINEIVNDFLNKLSEKYGEDFEKKVKLKIDSIINSIEIK